MSSASARESSAGLEANGTVRVRAMGKVRARPGDPVAIAFALHGGVNGSNMSAEFQHQGNQLPGMHQLCFFFVLNASFG